MAEWVYFIHPARGELRPFRVSLLRGRDERLPSTS
jgi:hypothetical protein